VSGGRSGLLTNTLPVLRYFGALVWRYRPSYVFVVAGNILLSGLSPFVNIVMPKYIIDELLGHRRIHVLVIEVAVLVGANFAFYLLNNLRDYQLERAHLFFDRKLEELLGRQAMEMDFEYTENPQVLTQLEKARTGVSWYSGGIAGLSGNLTSIVSSLVQLGGTLYIMLVLSPWLIGVMLGVVALSLFLTSREQQMQVLFMKDLVGINRRFSYYFGMLKNFAFGKDIRLYDAAPLLLERTDRYIDQDWQVQMRRSRVANRFGVLVTALGGAQQVLLYGYLGLRALSGAITIGDLQMLIGAANAFAGALNGVLGQVIDLGKNAEFMRDFMVFMEYPPAKRVGTEGPPQLHHHLVELRNVSFRYPGSDRLALENVSLQIPAGQRIAVVGPNGAGKTTFVKLLTRLYDATEGEILLDGQDIRRFDLDEYARLFAVVFQDFKLLSVSIEDNVTLGDGRGAGRIEHALHTAGLAEKVAGLPRGAATPVYKNFDEDGIEFSGGEGQKLAIARAIHRDAPIVVLDEPTAALDPLAEYEVYHHFDRLVGKKTAIYISHRLSSCRFADRIAVFDQGRLAECGTHEELLDRAGLYAQMWHAQAQWYV